MKTMMRKKWRLPYWIIVEENEPISTVAKEGIINFRYLLA
jgi:hypothetical protein